MGEHPVRHDGSALRARVIAEFTRRFGERPTWVARAPGRVNLIGDHTDYNDGFVLPLAIDRAVWIALRPRDDAHVALHSLDFHRDVTFDVGGEAARTGGWQEYVRGVGWALGEAGHRVQGWEGVVAGDVPLGAGLSSSAALELAAARAFAGAARLEWEPVEMARIAQRAENAWVGVNCGIMDQLISATGLADHAVLIDCRSLATRPVPIPADAAVVVLDTSTRRGLLDSAYNERRAQCEAAARFFGVPALRDVTTAAFAGRADELDPLTRRRARHVITENARVVAAADALAAGDVQRVGRLMRESHASLRDDFEVSSEALDTMVALADEHPGCRGARMTGAGFGGAAVALVDAAVVADFADEVARRYRDETGKQPVVSVVHAAQGATLAAP